MLLAAFVVTALAPHWVGASAAAADHLDVVAVVPGADQVSLLASVAPAPDPVLRPEAFSVTAAGADLPVRAMPVVSDQMSVAVVVDASVAGAPALPDGQRGAATLLLRLPMKAQVSVVTDADVPTVVAPPAPGPKDALGGLNAITSAGGRNTSDALGLALRQLAGAAGARPQVVVLYTSAPDASGEAAADLAGRLMQAGALLAVVTPGAASPYWSGVARDTGGVVASTDHGADPAAFDRVAATLAGRYLLAVPTPEQLPATVSVRVRTASGTLSADSSIPAPAALWSGAGGAPGPGLLTLTIGLGVLFLVGGAVVPLYARAGSRTRRGAVEVAGHGRAAPWAIPSVPAHAPATAIRSAPVRSRQNYPRPARSVPAPAPATSVQPVPVRSGPAPSAPARSVPATSPPATSAPARSVADPAPATSVPARSVPARASATGASPEPVHSMPATGDVPAPRREAPGRDGGDSATGGRVELERDSTPAGDRAGARPAARRSVPAPDSGSLTYADLDAHVARVAADVENGLRERRQAVAQLALAARGRTDLLDRIIESERRMTHSALDRWPPTATVLDLLSAARRVTSGDATLVGPGGIRVEQTVLRTPDGQRTLLRLSRSDGPVVHRWTAEELARDVDLETLAEDPHWEHTRS